MVTSFQTCPSGKPAQLSPLPAADPGDSERMSAFLRFAVEAAHYGWRLDPVIVFATSTPLTVSIPAASLRWGRRIPMVFEVRDLWPDAPIALGALRKRPLILAAKLLERLAYRSAHRVIALSPPQAAAIRQRGGGDVLVVPNFSNAELFDNADNDAPELPNAVGERPIVLYAGARGLVNGAGWLVDVAAACPDDDIVFVMVGAGREDDAIRARATELGVLDRTLFMLPERPKATIASAHAALDSRLRPDHRRARAMEGLAQQGLRCLRLRDAVKNTFLLLLKSDIDHLLIGPPA